MRKRRRVLLMAAAAAKGGRGKNQWQHGWLAEGKWREEDAA